MRTNEKLPNLNIFREIMMKKITLYHIKIFYGFYLFFIFWQGELYAQEPFPEKGTLVETRQSVKVRETPPSQKLLFITSPGKEISNLKEREKIQVQEVKEINTPFGNDIWIKGKTDSGETGWVFYGGKNKPANFKIIKRE